MMVVPNNKHEAEALRLVSSMASEYANRMSACQFDVQVALNTLIEAGFDPGVAVHIVNGKFCIHPPKNIGVAEESNGSDVSVHIPEFPDSLRPSPDEYEED